MPGADPGSGRREIPDEATAGLAGLADEMDPGAEDEDWDDPDCSCPREYVGVPHRELIAEADAWARQTAAKAAAEPADVLAAGFLARDGVPVARGDAARGPAAGFCSGGVFDRALPGAALAGFADDASGENRDFAGVRDDELIGLLRAWQRIESFGTSGKLSAIAELIRRRAANGTEPPGPGGMPTVWSEFCADELAAALVTSAQAATKLLALAHDLATKLPGTARALREGVLDYVKAKIISDATSVLSAADAQAVEAIILPRAGGLTPGKLRVLTARAVISIDPAAAAERRERAQKDARVERWVEDAGTAALCGRDLPPADVLAADQRITAWARELKAAGLDGSMDELRARAFLDFLLGSDSRPLPSPARDVAPEPDVAGDGPGRREAGSGLDSGGGGTGGLDSGEAEDSGHSQAGQERDEAGGPAAGGGGLAARARGLAAGAGGPGPVDPQGGQAQPAWPGTAARINLTVPLLTLLGLAERPGELAGLGAVDPALARELARSSSDNPRTGWCVTVTDADGRPVGHGCARPAPGGRGKGGRKPARSPDGGSGTGNRGSPEFGQERTGHGPRLGGAGGRGGKSGFGRWRLRGFGTSDLLVTIGPLAFGECDHRNESRGYVPSARLRHLVETRNDECTWPPCRRAATRCDFEHAIPFEAGGKTCECNGGPRCRRHHRAKQATGWRLEQPEPGYHRWTTPSGREYLTDPAMYPI